MSLSGRVVGLVVATGAEAPTQLVSEAVAIAGVGLEGDRYALQTGSFSPKPGTGRQITLIEREAVEAYVQESGHAVTAADMRRNVITEGVRLNEFVGQEFTVGGTRLRGMRLCEPCTTLQRLLGGDVLRGLVHRGGLRADVVEGGTIRVGDGVSP